MLDLQRHKQDAIKTREDEIKSLSNTLEKTKEQLSNSVVQNELLQQNLSQLRDENIRIKNDGKARKAAEKENCAATDIDNLCTDLSNFKQFVHKQLGVLMNKIESNHASVSTDSVLSTHNLKKKKKKKTDLNVNKAEELQHINRYEPLQFATNNNLNVEETTSSEDEDESPRIVPGNKKYSEVVDGTGGRKAIVFSTSMTRGIDVGRFNQYYHKGTARFQRWRGGRAEHIKHYLETHLKDEKPDTVLLQYGGNNLPTRRNNPIPVVTIANDIIEGGQICKKNGVRDVFVSSVMPRKQ